MIKVNKPEYNQKEIIDDCTSNMQAGTRLNNIIASESIIIQSSLEYDELATRGNLTTINTHELIEGGASKTDMVWLYDKKFVGDGGRKHYDKIMLLPKNGICPLCGKRTVSTLDHYLPKTQFPTYAVTPYNLIATCADCNKVKSDNVIILRENETIHPYYDDFNDEVWIKGELIEEFPIGFNFTVYKPKTWSDEKFKRAENHFKTFRLNALYSAHASEMFAPYKVQIMRLYNRRGIEVIKEDLEDKIESYRSIRLNTWEAAMFTALLNSEWFFGTYLHGERV